MSLETLWERALLPAAVITAIAVVWIAFARVSPDPKPEAHPAPTVVTVRKIDNYTTLRELMARLGRPNSVYRDGNSTVLQYTDLNTEPTMWQLDVRLSGGGSVRVPRN